MTKIGGSVQDVTNVSVLNFILKVDDVISYLYLVFADIMNEIVQYACSKKRISFFEEIWSHRVKNLGFHTNTDEAVVFGSNENFAGRIYWDIDGSHTVSNIFEEQSWLIRSNDQTGVSNDMPTKYFLHEISVYKRNFEF